MLDGVSGAPAVDREALVGLLLRVSELVTAFPEIEELDLNPVLARPSGLDVLDVRILLVPAERDALAAISQPPRTAPEISAQPALETIVFD